jgi:NADH-quinone oxidoreductase subunit E
MIEALGVGIIGPHERTAVAGNRVKAAVLWSGRRRKGMEALMTAAKIAPIEPALKIIEELSPVTEGQIIPLLQRLQDVYGYLPQDVVIEVARRTGLPASRVYGVATFYAQFRLKPGGRHTIRCCRGTACHVRGSKTVLNAVKSELGIDDGETTEDMKFSLETVACLGTCFLAPVIMVNNDYFGGMTPGQIRNVLDKYK